MGDMPFSEEKQWSQLWEWGAGYGEVGGGGHTGMREGGGNCSLGG